MSYKDLYRPILYFDDPKVELYTKRQGFIKKKVEGIRDQLGFNKGSVKVYCIFHSRGRYMCFYTDVPKKGGELIQMVRTAVIEDLQEEVKGKLGHFVIKTKSNESLEFKCDDVKESSEWVKTIRFFKDYYRNDKNNEGENIQTELDIETKLAISSENELDNWDTISSKFDYTGFINDKGLSVLFENNIIEIIKNRMLISSAQKETRHKKGASMIEQQTPQTPTTPSKRIDRFNLNALTGSQYYFVIICQRPIHHTDQEFALTDDVILEKDSLPDWMEFNKLYFFQYSARGDITTYKKFLEVS